MSDTALLPRMSGSSDSIPRTGKTQSFAPFACLGDQGAGRACGPETDELTGLSGSAVLLLASLGWMRHAAGGQIPVDRPVERHEHRLEQFAHHCLVRLVKGDDRSPKPDTPGGCVR